MTDTPPPPATQVHRFEPAQHRFQFSLLQLLMVVLSIGGCFTAWHLGWSSFALPIILGWLWWFAFPRRTWRGRMFLCLLVPAIICTMGLSIDLFAAQQNMHQRALPAACMNALRQVPGKWCLAELLLVGGGLLACVLFIGGYLATRIRLIRNWRTGWAVVGVGLGLLVVSVLAGYSFSRTASRRAAVRAHWPPDVLVIYEGRHCTTSFLTEDAPGRRSIQLRVRVDGFTGWRMVSGSCHAQIVLPLEDFAELWGLLEADSVFCLCSDQSFCNQIDGAHWNLEIAAGPEQMCVNTGDSDEFGLPLVLFKDHLLKWLSRKGVPGTSCMQVSYTDE